MDLCILQEQRISLKQEIADYINIYISGITSSLYSYAYKLENNEFRQGFLIRTKYFIFQYLVKVVLVFCSHKNNNCNFV